MLTDDDDDNYENLTNHLADINFVYSSFVYVSSRRSIQFFFFQNSLNPFINFFTHQLIVADAGSFFFVSTCWIAVLPLLISLHIENGISLFPFSLSLVYLYVCDVSFFFLYLRAAISIAIIE